jgi:glutamate formiminotransferase
LPLARSEEGRPALFEAVPNFSEGRDLDLVGRLGAGRHTLDVHADADHNRSVITLAAVSAEALIEDLLDKVAIAAVAIDLRRHSGVHPRVGATDVIPIVPLQGAEMAQASEAAHRLGRRIWQELRLPVFYYGAAASGRRLADIRRGGLAPDEGGPDLHPSAGAVCVGARAALVAYNIVFEGMSVPAARPLVRGMRLLPGVQALAFRRGADGIQLSMNLTRLEEAGVGPVYEAASALAGRAGEPELVGLCPVRAAGPGCAGGLLEAGLAAAAATAGAARARRYGGEELERLASRLAAEGESLKALGIDQESILGGAERALALIRVMRAAGTSDPEIEAFLAGAASGFRGALERGTERDAAARVALVDRWLAAG